MNFREFHKRNFAGNEEKFYVVLALIQVKRTNFRFYFMNFSCGVGVVMEL